MSEVKGEVLLSIAREAILDEFGRGCRAKHSEPWLSELGATFVTLTRNGELRGCIGTLEAHRPLGEDVAQNAVAAAFYDHRFPAVTKEELDDLQIEVSLLGALEPVPCTSQEGAIQQIQPQEHGVVFEHRGRKSTFLPQVWEKLSDPEDFFRQLKVKAGLPPDFWAEDVRVHRYTLHKWREGEGE